jgi:HD superfamily phosphohydrolase YqeK
MQTDQLNRLERWFKTYTGSFLTGDATKDSPLTLKIDHTTRVQANICDLGRSIDLPPHRLRLAETIGLLHDVGRFAQYQRYGTFNDSRSINHAKLGIDVIKENRLLADLDSDDQRLISDAIRFHNLPALPANKPQASQLFMRLIRDADKLDIWKLFADYYRNRQMPDAAIVQHLSDQPTWTATIVESIVQRRIARFQDMNSLTDFKLLKLSWVFDLNFPASVRLAGQRKDLATIAESLPDAPALRRAVSIIMDRVNEGSLSTSD